MDQEPADELVRIERHRLVAAGSVDPIVPCDSGLWGGADRHRTAAKDPGATGREIPFSAASICGSGNSSKPRSISSNFGFPDQSRMDSLLKAHI